MDIRTSSQEYHYDYRRVIKARCFSLYGNRCNSSTCRWINEDGSTGCTDDRALQIDHIVSYKVKPTRNRGGMALWLDILNKRVNKEDFQLICANCNWIKRMVNNENRSLEEKHLPKVCNIPPATARLLIDNAMKHKFRGNGHE